MNPIKAMRESRTMTQQTLAMAACVSLSTVKRAEAGKAISKESMLSIASVLETEPRLLAPVTPRPSKPAPILIRDAVLMTVMVLAIFAIEFGYVRWVDGWWLDFVLSAEGMPFREMMLEMPAQVSAMVVIGRLAVITIPPALAVCALALGIYRLSGAKAGGHAAGGWRRWA